MQRCGSVGRVVTFNARGSRFESSHRQCFIMDISTVQKSWKGKKGAEKSPLKLEPVYKKFYHSLSHIFSLSLSLSLSLTHTHTHTHTHIFLLSLSFLYFPSRAIFWLSSDSVGLKIKETFFHGYLSKLEFATFAQNNPLKRLTNLDQKAGILHECF